MLLETLCPGSKYRICPGLPDDALSQLHTEISYARKWGFPFRVDHRDCKLWFPLEKVNPLLRREPTCDNCTYLLYYAKKAIKRQLFFSPSTKEKHTHPSSNYPMKFLTPLSRKRRLSHKRKQNFTATKELKTFRYQQYDINVSDATNTELLSLVAQIEDKLWAPGSSS